MAAQVLTRASSIDAAIEYLSQRWSRQRGDVMVGEALAASLFERQSYEAAAEIAKHLIDRSPSRAAFGLAATIAFLKDNIAECLDVASRWLKSDPRSTGASKNALLALYRLGQLSLITELPSPTRETAGPIIPQKIFQFWDTASPPVEVEALMNTWSEKNRSYQYVRFDDSSAAAFMEQAFPSWFSEALLYCHHPAMRSDLIRLAYLFVHGGIYVDADDECLQPIDRVFSQLGGNASFIVSAAKLQPIHLNNWFIASVPQHPILADALRESCEGILAFKAAGTRSDIWDTTGPGLLTRTVAKYLLRAKAEGRFPREKLVILSYEVYSRTLVRSHEDLQYKQTSHGNWRLV
ncbi:MAG: hypothetical protein JO264_08155 [Acidisphaera sp.]|nr:hypothetical protein [Acidisphaera sp.]